MMYMNSIRNKKYSVITLSCFQITKSNPQGFFGILEIRFSENRWKIILQTLIYIRDMNNNHINIVWCCRRSPAPLFLIMIFRDFSGFFGIFRMSVFQGKKSPNDKTHFDLENWYPLILSYQSAVDRYPAPSLSQSSRLLSQEMIKI